MNQPGQSSTGANRGESTLQRRLALWAWAGNAPSTLFFLRGIEMSNTETKGIHSAWLGGRESTWSSARESQWATSRDSHWLQGRDNQWAQSQDSHWLQAVGA